jgi:uncharacterized HAD superfamily protein
MMVVCGAFFTTTHNKDKFFHQHRIQIFHELYFGQLGQSVKNLGPTVFAMRLA